MQRLREENINNTNNVNTAGNVNTVSSTVNAAGTNEVNAVGGRIGIELPFDPKMPALEDDSIFDFSSDDEDDGVVADMNNLDTAIQVSPILTTRIHKDRPLDQVIGDLQSATQTRKMLKILEEHWNKKDEMGIVIKKNKARLVSQGYTQEEGIDYDEVFAPVARIEAIRLFLAYASFKDFLVYQMNVKSTFLYGKIEEEVYVCQPSGFEDLNFPDRVYKVEKSLYGLHQAPKAWFTKVKTARTPMETQKPLLKDEDGEEVDVHMYRLMIGLLMYLTSSRPDIMFTVCCLSPKITAWNEFSSTMAFAIICLATNQKFNFSKFIFDSMIRNLDNLFGKFKMYLRGRLMLLMQMNKLPELVFNDADKEMFDVDVLDVEVINTAKLIIDAAQDSATGDIVSTASTATTVSAATITTDTITTIGDITLAQELKEIKSTKPKQKGIDIQELEKAEKLEEANISLIETWDDIHAKIDADHQLAERMQEQEKEELSIVEKSILFQQLLEKKRKHFAAKRAEEKRNKPPIKAQQRKIIVSGKQKVEDDKEMAELKQFMEFIPDEEVAIDAIPLSVKSPKIVD
nr:retrovirus-related Pol polyprotein from transposon TNT 1-94 [Tanacetum cinerariifolium]